MRSVTLSVVIIAISISTVIGVRAQVPFDQGQVIKFASRYTHVPAAYAEGAAESVAYDPSTQRVVFSNALENSITLLDVSNSAAPSKVRTIFMGAYGGGVNSVAVRNGVIAVAVEDVVKQSPGRLVMFDTNGEYLSQVVVGSLPDQCVFTPDGLTVIVCNEGEPNSSYTEDPEGSVSIVNVSNPRTPILQTVTFSSLNDKVDSLRALGIRIFGPGATVSKDLEPEYAAISPDSKTAYVSIQEANALAIIDIPSATLTRLVPLGFKDHRRGVADISSYPWNDRPVLASTDKGQEILLGGFSGLWFEGYGATPERLVFLTHPDRGPNAEPSNVGGVVSRPFVLPTYQAEVIRFELDRTTGEFTLLNRVPLFRKDGTTPITGLPNLQAGAPGMAYTDEIPVDLYGVRLDNDPYGADLEGMVVDANGTWWFVDEYRPAIYNFSNNGVLIERYVPEGTAASVGAADGAFGVEAIPAVYAKRRANRGFEAVALEGNMLYAFIQSPIDNPDMTNDATSKVSGWTRILAFDISTKQIVGEYLYPLFERSLGVDKIGDAVSTGPGSMMVIERDDRLGPNARKYVYEIKLNGATNLLTNPPVLAIGETLESLSFAQVVAKGIVPVHKKKSVSLASQGYTAGDKPEGLARISDREFAVVNDNDFGVGASTLPTPPTGLIELNPDAIPTLGLIQFSGGGLDGSDRDNAINISNWPVYGMYMPDAITVLTVNGQTLIATANEGDAREYDPLEEEVRISSSRVVLDPAVTAAYPSIKSNAGIGRLNITNTMGDLDGDGDYDELYSFGARSVTLWNTDGNLVWDSGDLMEKVTSMAYPTRFNASNTDASFDSRSDNKGPEPEAVTWGTINDSTYVFVGLERIGHTMMLNVTNPLQPTFVDYLNTRDFSVAQDVSSIENGTLGDVGPEVMAWVSPAQSPNGFGLVITGNEVSGTVSMFEVRIPQITSQPESTVRVCYGEPLILRVQVLGTNLSYQWAKNGTPITGATNSTYAVTASDSTFSGVYTCIVGAVGGRTVTTVPTTVIAAKRTRILSAPKALYQPDLLDDVRLTVEATDESGEQYQWYRSGQPLSDGQTYRGTSTPELTIVDVSYADTALAYYCVVTGGCVQERTADIAVLVPRVVFVNEPDTVSVCPGGSAVFECLAIAEGGDTAVTYQWKVYQGRYLDESAQFRGTRTTRLRITNAQHVDDQLYVCVATGQPSGRVRFSQPARLAVTPVPEIIVDPTDGLSTSSVAICEGDNIGLRVRALGVQLRYQWFRDNQPIAGATLASLNVRESGSYRVRVYGDCSPMGINSRSLQVVLLQSPKLGVNTPSLIRGRIGGAFSIGFALREGSSPLEYQWFKNDVLMPRATNESYSINNASKDDEGYYTCRIVNRCGDVETRRTQVVIDQPVSVAEELIERFAVVVAPQPMTESTTIRYTSQKTGQMSWVLATTDGTKLFAPRQENVHIGVNTIQIDQSMVGASGLYHVHMSIGTDELVIPIIVAR